RWVGQGVEGAAASGRLRRRRVPAAPRARKKGRPDAVVELGEPAADEVDPAELFDGERGGEPVLQRAAAFVHRRRALGGGGGGLEPGVQLGRLAEEPGGAAEVAGVLFL